MLKLLYKEFRLAAHPTLYIFLFMGVLILIPEYPYCMVFFFGCLAPFITLYNGRENHDAFYTASLPVKKSDVVKSKYMLFVVVELAQIFISLPFAYLRLTNTTGNNPVGIDPNFAYYGFGLIIFTVFNILFFTEFYKTAYKVGKSFIIGIIPALLLIFIVEGITHFHGFEWIDQTTPSAMRTQLPILIIGIVIFILGNLGGYHVSRKRFEKVDL